jgi:hypothetical protein
VDERVSADQGVATSLSGDASTTGTLTIGDLTRTLPEAEARTLFLAAAAIAARKPGALTINGDTCVVITATTHISLTITNGFVNAYDPGAALVSATSRPRR